MVALNPRADGSMSPEYTPDSLDYMIHAASNAYPYLIQKNPIETMQDNF